MKENLQKPPNLEENESKSSFSTDLMRNAYQKLNLNNGYGRLCWKD